MLHVVSCRGRSVVIMVPLAFIVFPFIDCVSLITRGRTYNMIDMKVEFTLGAAIAFHALIQLQNGDSLSPLKVQSVTTVTVSGLAG